jgi:hypothetical protein
VNRYLGVIFLTVMVFLGGVSAGQCVIIFSDNFNNGLDSNMWKAEDGHIVSQAQHASWSDRFLDIVTQKNDFADFTLSWSMQFNNGGSDRDHRTVYLRSNDVFGAFLNGYICDICIGYPYFNADYVGLSKYVNGVSTDYGYINLGNRYFNYGEWYNFEVAMVANTLNIKWWGAVADEPIEWMFSATDSSSNPLTSGHIGFGNYFSASTGIDNVNVASATSPVPEPASIMLFGTGLLGMLGFFRKGKKNT